MLYHDMTRESKIWLHCGLLRRVEIQGQKGLRWLRMAEMPGAQVSGAPGEGDDQRYLRDDDEMLVYPPGEKANFWGAERRIGGILSCLLLDIKLIFNINSEMRNIKYWNALLR